MGRSTKQWAAVVAAVVLLMLPGPLVLALFPAVFHLHAWRLAAAVVVTFPVTIPALLAARRYFNRQAGRG